MSSFKVAVLISGNGSNLQAIIDKFKKDKLIELCCVISNKQEAFGLERASKAGIKNYYIDHKKFVSREEFERELIEVLEEHSVDLIVLAGFMRILSNIFVDKYIGKLVNIHPSLLPKHKGLDTHRKVLDNNDKYHGVTVHFVDNTLDGGPICAQSRFEVKTKSIEELEESVHKLEHEIYPLVIKEIAQGKMRLSGKKVIKK
tara:strand:+ start:1165 stop:1767 length:603 start_codon:yes stop_codon:yes gene_type:complete